MYTWVWYIEKNLYRLVEIQDMPEDNIITQLKSINLSNNILPMYRLMPPRTKGYQDIEEIHVQSLPGIDVGYHFLLSKIGARWTVKGFECWPKLDLYNYKSYA